MASKKPAKKPASAVASSPKVDEGVMVRFIGAFKGVTYTCPYCGSVKRRAMMREYKGTMYCSRNCVRGVKRNEESNVQ